MIPEVKDHKEQGVGRLLGQFKDKSNITALMDGWLQGIQTAEDSVFDLLNNRSLSTATGVTLDYIGGIVGASRKGKSDESYRDAIKLQILVNTSEGTPSDILEILSLITEATLVKSYPHYPVGGSLYTNGPTIPSDLASTITQASLIAHGDIHIYHDPDNECLIPVEAVRTTGVLVDNEGNEIVDNEGNNIVVGGLGAELSKNSWRGVLAESDGSVTQYGIPCEGYTA